MPVSASLALKVPVTFANVSAPAVSNRLIAPGATSTGASLTALTVTLRLCVNVSTPPLAVPPLSCTVHVMLPVPLAFATVLYFKPCSSLAVSVAPDVTAVVPSALYRLMKLGTPVTVYVKLCVVSSSPPPTP